MSVPDKGPWQAHRAKDGFWEVASADFTHDVVLSISGDFGLEEERKEYAMWLAKTLNESQVKEGQ